MSVVLSEHLPLLASAPDGIQKLRGLILELAVRGKLVSQDPNDEPASELLKRIAKERARLEAEGTCKKIKATPLVGEDEQPFALPDGWAWIRLGQVGDWGAGATPLRSNPRYYGGSIPWFKSGELTADFISDAEEHVTELALKECSLRQNRTGDVLIAMYGATIGKTAILAKPATTNQAVCACTPNTGVFNRYLLTLLKALKPNFIGQGAGGAQPNISREKIVATIAALPPEAEQHRIVAKVDELMALCDRLEAEQTDAEAAHAKLVKTLLGTLTQSTDAAKLTANWQRLAEHFDTLFTTESSLDALKQTILQLAVMGKLVPQDPKDEPANELLKRIAKERARLEAEGTCKKSKATPLVGEGNLPFALPGGWSCVHFDEIVHPSKPISYGVLVPGPDVSDGVPFVRIADLSITSPSVLPEKTIDRSVDAQFARTRLDGGEILMGVVGSIGKLGVAPMSWKGANIARAICRIVPTPHFDKSFLILLLQSKVMQMAFNGDTRTLAQPTLNVGLIRTAHTPIPPLAEQHRIVAKVDELMALCDRLKADLAESRTRQACLSATLIESALQAA